jgi:ABC-type antimicrobial peptide transport system permease subunit
VPDVRAVALAIDPVLEVHQTMALSEPVRGDVDVYDFWITLVVVVSGIALLLSPAGIYAAMSFAVSRRTREIGIRVALGADRARLVTSIFRRPLLQVGAGVLLGTLLTMWLMATPNGGLDVRGVAAVGVYAALVCAVCMLACVVPTRRALRVEPTDALRAE